MYRVKIKDMDSGESAFKSETKGVLLLCTTDTPIAVNAALIGEISALDIITIGISAIKTLLRTAKKCGLVENDDEAKEFLQLLSNKAMDEDFSTMIRSSSPGKFDVDKAIREILDEGGLTEE